jgi:(p)ppGpp synthase/HD superfamily hydrolase
MIDSAHLLARLAHADQMYSAGKPYIEHVNEVVDFCRRHTNEENVIVTATLHDVVEDSVMTLDAIGYFFGYHIAYAVESLTRGRTETYWEYIERLRKNPVAVFVKYADLTCNLRACRAPDCPPHKKGGAVRYTKALDMIRYSVEVSGYFDTLNDYLEVRNVDI